MGRYVSIINSNKAALLITQGGMKRLGESVLDGLKKNNIDVKTLFFSGECSDQKVERHVKSLEDEAIKEMQIALELDPYHIFYNSMLSAAFNQARLFDDAIAKAQKTLELVPNAPHARQTLAIAYACQGRYADGMAALQPVRDLTFQRSFLGYIYGKAGQQKEAQTILDEFLERSKKEYFSPFSIAMV